MPNWCANKVTFRHSDKSKLTALVKAFNDDGLLEYLHPFPKDLEATAITQATHWGTKWEISCDCWSENEADNSLTFNFDSAWSPPIEAYEAAIATHGFQIEANWCEPGCAFIGEFVDREIMHYDFDDDIPSDLREEYAWAFEDLEEQEDESEMERTA